MKGQKDEIKKLFDDYADELTPRQDLASKAKTAMSVKNNKQSVKSNKQSANRRIGWIASLASAFVVLIICVGIVLPFINGNGSDIHPGIEQTPSQGPGQNAQTGDESLNSIVYYAISDVKGKSVGLSDVDDKLQISRLEYSGYQIVSERYYAFYTDEGELAYIKALIGVRGDSGFAEITIIAEADGMVRDDFKDIYLQYGNLDESLLVRDTQLDDKGEYVTQGFFKARDMHFYVYATTGASRSLSEKIISNLL